MEDGVAMGRLLAVISSLAALLVGMAPDAEAGGALGTGRAGGGHFGLGFRAPHVTRVPSPRRHFSLFLGQRVVAAHPFDSEMDTFFPGDPATVQVVVGPGPTPPAPVAPAPKAVEAPGPKFVFPPSPGADPAPGRDAVIVQHGSRIEVTSFPTDR